MAILKLAEKWNEKRQELRTESACNMQGKIKNRQSRHFSTNTYDVFLAAGSLCFENIFVSSKIRNSLSLLHAHIKLKWNNSRTIKFYLHSGTISCRVLLTQRHYIPSNFPTNLWNFDCDGIPLVNVLNKRQTHDRAQWMNCRATHLVRGKREAFICFYRWLLSWCVVSHRFCTDRFS